MKISFHSLFILALAILISGCSGFPRVAEGSDIAALQRTAVLSALGNDFNGAKVGITVFNNQFFTSKVPDWIIDEYAENRVLQLLPPQLNAVSIATTARDPSTFNRQMPLPEILKLAHASGFDSLLLLRPQKSDNYPFHKPPYGFFDRKLGSIPEMPGIKSISLGGKCVYAMYVVQLIDLKTQKDIGFQWGGREPCKRDADDDLFFNSRFEDYNESQRNELKNRLLRQLDRSLGEALVNMGVLK